ncbi:carboxypeptidase-like regulatory domain-containing protein [Pedobacter panaciterrae]
MKTYIILFFASLISLTALAQVKQGVISSTVKDSKNQAIGGATVRLLKAADTAIITTRTTDIDGKFQFNDVTKGSYLLRITAVGYKEFNSSPLHVLDNAGVVFPVIILLLS